MIKRIIHIILLNHQWCSCLSKIHINRKYVSFFRSKQHFCSFVSLTNLKLFYRCLKYFKIFFWLFYFKRILQWHNSNKCYFVLPKRPKFSFKKRYMYMFWMIQIFLYLCIIILEGGKCFFLISLKVLIAVLLYL